MVAGRKQTVDRTKIISEFLKNENKIVKDGKIVTNKDPVWGQILASLKTIYPLCKMKPESLHSMATSRNI